MVYSLLCYCLINCVCMNAGWPSQPCDCGAGCGTAGSQPTAVQNLCHSGGICNSNKDGGVDTGKNEADSERHSHARSTLAVHILHSLPYLLFAMMPLSLLCIESKPRPEQQYDLFSFLPLCCQVVRNSGALGDALVKRGFMLTTGGTDNHLVLWDLRPLGLTGSKMEKLLERASVSAQMNIIKGMYAFSTFSRPTICSPSLSPPFFFALVYFSVLMSTHLFSCGHLSWWGQRRGLINHHHHHKTTTTKLQISANKNAVPGDKSALAPGGVRLGTCAMTTRGLREDDFDQVG